MKDLNDRQICFAPMEGITGFLYRNIHAEMFPGVDRYYTPFLSVTHTHSFKTKEKRDVDPANNTVPALIPQLLTNKAEDFLWAAEYLASFGYREINLNLGCPSPTVTAKGKGAGFLADPDQLDRFFEQVFKGLENKEAPLSVSVKTRLGVHDPSEAVRLMQIYNRYPLSELIIHARVKDDLYKGSVRPDAFEYCLEESLHPVCYNGDITTAEEYRAIPERFPGLSAVMIGRGFLADPALILKLKGRAAGEDHRRLLLSFHDRLFDEYSRIMAPKDAVFHLKEVWSHMKASFPGCEKEMRKIMKAKNAKEYLAACALLQS